MMAILRFFTSIFCAILSVLGVMDPTNLMSGAINAGYSAITVEPTTQYANETPTTESVYTTTEGYVEPATEQYASNDETVYDVDGDGYTSYTVMVYMVGSDLESNGGMASYDLKEMMESEFDTSKNNVVVYAGGASKWQSNLPADGNMYLEVKNNDLQVLNTVPQENMGKSSTLSNFLEYAYDNYKTDKYILVLWDHGGGPNVGYGSDENYGYDSLTLSEMQAALVDSPFNSSNKLELVSFDACLMASMEVAEIFAPFAHYFVGSEEVEPGYGHNYSYLKSLNSGYATGETIGREIVDSYMGFYNQIITYGSQYECDITLSCMDLTKLPMVKAAMDTLFRDAEAGLVFGNYNQISKQRANTKSFGVYTSSNSYDLVDLYALSDNYTWLSAGAGQLKDAISDFVVYNQTNVNNAHGVSVYYPYENKAYQSTWLSMYDLISPSKEYSGFLKMVTGDEATAQAFIESYSNDVQGGQEGTTEGTTEEPTLITPIDPGQFIQAKLPTASDDAEYANVNWTLSTDGITDRPTDGFGIKLTPDQQKYCQAITCVVLQKSLFDNDAVMAPLAIVKGNEFDGNGEVYVDISEHCIDFRDQDTADSENQAILVFSNSTEPGVFQIQSAMLQSISESKFANANINLRLSDDGYTYDIIQSVYASDSENQSMVANKEYVNVYDYEILSIAWPTYTIAYNADGTAKHFADWEVSGEAEGFDTKLAGTDNKISFTKLKVAEENRGNYFCQYLIMDVYGQVHASDIIPLQ